ncbi:uncharacterized protein LOC125560752 [Nematostella vectensis]|uniref:uncharacterized protein LOC125560752 n=1 Tax=Nematostella vectensis TaxID=45351 RepID=UPI00207779B9|nr:uncharacterized protein LOC125560752 [Nematostella vectensis]
MDDICHSEETPDKVQQLVKDLDKVLQNGGFHVKKWTTSGSAKDDDAAELDLLKTEHEEKVLGIAWDSKTDVLRFKVQKQSHSTSDGKEKGPWTKRKILSRVARLYDPIGYTAAVVIKAKIGIQKLWQLGYEWDQPIKPPLAQEAFFTDLDELNKIELPRCLTPPNAVGLPTLCIFSDASREAFGAVAYLRWQASVGSYEVRFVAAKSRVKELAIPRLELQAAVLAARLHQTLQEELRIECEKAILFTDSMIVYSWVRGSPRSFKPFVSARISEIQDKTDPNQWRHIPGSANVADDVFRGLSVQELKGRWTQCPAFLQSNEDEWPQEAKYQEPDNESDQSERRKEKVCAVTGRAEEAIDVSKFSEWRRLVRVTARIQRLAEKIRLQKYEQEGRQGPLAPEELKKAEEHWIKKMQDTLHGRHEKGEFAPLSPFVDDKGIIRVGGRVDAALVSYDTRHPILLPSDHRGALLITRHVHKHGHLGVAATTAKIRAKYRIVKGNKLSKIVEKECVFCKRLAHQTETQIMSALPQLRLAPYTPPFFHTSCDYFGPINVRIGRNKSDKYYGVIFTCLNTRAVHLEMAVDLSTMDFLQVLRRFFSIRGYPATVLSDNSSQMVGAERELRELIKGLNDDQLRQFNAEKGIRWIFITPGAPH